MRLVSIAAGSPLPGRATSLDGAVLARDLVVAGERWSKGRRLSAADLAALAAGDVVRPGPWSGGTRAAGVLTLLVPEPGDVHEDDAAARLAAAIAGPGLVARGPAESRIDLLAAEPGEVRVAGTALGRVNGIDGLSIFTVLDGQLVAAGALVASVKTGPHLVPEAALARAEAIAARRRGPLVEVRPFRERRIAAVVKETLAEAARARFEATLHAKVNGLGCTVAGIRYVADDPGAVVDAFRLLIRGAGAVDLVLTAGAASTDPSDAVFAALAAVGGRVTSHGVPAHPGSMLWLGRAARTAFLGLPTCGAYSRATAVDLLLPWLVAGEPPTRATVARLGHGGILTRDMRFRFPPYARELDAPDG